MKALAFLATKKGLLLVGAAAFLILRGKKAVAAKPEPEVRGDGQLRVTVSSYYDEYVGGVRFCYEEGSDENDLYFKRAVGCDEADAYGVVRPDGQSQSGVGGYGSVGLYNVRSG